MSDQILRPGMQSSLPIFNEPGYYNMQSKSEGELYYNIENIEPYEYMEPVANKYEGLKDERKPGNLNNVVILPNQPTKKPFGENEAN